jgi:hypothetical protein
LPIRLCGNTFGDSEAVVCGSWGCGSWGTRSRGIPSGSGGSRDGGPGFGRAAVRGGASGSATGVSGAEEGIDCFGGRLRLAGVRGSGLNGRSCSSRTIRLSVVKSSACSAACRGLLSDRVSFGAFGVSIGGCAAFVSALAMRCRRLTIFRELPIEPRILWNSRSLASPPFGPVQLPPSGRPSGVPARIGVCRHRAAIS